jgi:hypothetical protein
MHPARPVAVLLKSIQTGNQTGATWTPTPASFSKRFADRGGMDYQQSTKSRVRFD